VSKRFERLTATVEAWVIGGVALVIAILYVVSRLRGS
jgi:hypothetical protein